MDTKKYLLSAAEIEALPGERKTHFLNPNAVRINKSPGDAVGFNHLGVHLIHVAPGKDSTEYHKHLYEEECIYVLQGRATAIIEGDRYPLGPGDFLGLPRNGGMWDLMDWENIAVVPRGKNRTIREE